MLPVCFLWNLYTCSVSEWLPCQNGSERAPPLKNARAAWYRISIYLAHLATYGLDQSNALVYPTYGLDQSNALVYPTYGRPRSKQCASGTLMYSSLRSHSGTLMQLIAVKGAILAR